ncbi:glycosyl hydrolase family 28-related protein [Paenibacillus sp. MBLB4367]|uniref:glycosyl hydrolase family 28-related protein n=1 Tax=Paenibacillus sp. MBLB4367 TaxID=3384767 RepID=UPI003907F060
MENQTRISRRKLLAAIGIAGTAVAVKGMLTAAPALGMEETVTNRVYKEEDKLKSRPFAEPDWYNVKTQGLKGDGAADDAPALRGVLQLVSLEEATLYVPKGMYRIASDLAVPANVHFVMDRGAKWVPDAGITLTFHGSITAGSYHIFAGQGTVLQKYR